MVPLVAVLLLLPLVPLVAVLVLLALVLLVADDLLLPHLCQVFRIQKEKN